MRLVQGKNAESAFVMLRRTTYKIVSSTDLGMEDYMRRLTVLALLAGLMSAACSNTAQKSGTNWSSLHDGSGSGKVAKVNNIKSLIAPGFY